LVEGICEEPSHNCDFKGTKMYLFYGSVTAVHNLFILN